MTDIEDLAKRIKELEDRVGSRQATQLDSSSVDVGDDDSLVVSDVVAAAASAVSFDIPGLQELLDLNAERLADAAAAVQEAMDAADAATEAGLAAGEEASQAADEALENAQAANDAAADAQTRAQAAADAAAAAGITAGSASGAAAAAQAAATAANTAAAAAQSTANGKNAVTYSTSVPSDTTNPGTRAGDIWFVRNASGWLSAQYEWSGSTWQVRNLDSAILAYIDAGKITAGTISADRIGANSITASKLAADSVTSNAILAGTIQAVDIAAGTITGDRIAAATLTASLLMADTLTSREIAADAILARNIKAAEITGAKIAAATITGGNIAANTITAGNIKAGTITANEIAANSITANEINLNTLNGKTITGATIQSAASGARLVMSGTALTVYSAGGTGPVGYIFADDSQGTDYSQVSIINNYSSTLGGSGLYVRPPRNPAASSYESTRKVNVALTHGLDAPVVQANTFVARGRAFYKYPVIDSPDNSAVTVTSDSYCVGMSTGAPVIFTTSNVAGSPVVVQPDQFRSTNTSDLSLSSFNHAFQIGPDTGTNLAMDNNEIMVRNNGSTSSLFIQGDGGNVGLGNSSSTVSIPGNLNYGGSILPIIQRGNGTYSGGNIAGNRGNVTVTINFPQAFSTVPTVVPISANSRILATISSVSTTQVQILLLNYTDTTVTSSVNYQWVAFGS